MKRNLLLIISLCVVIASYGQHQTNKIDKSGNIYKLTPYGHEAVRGLKSTGSLIPGKTSKPQFSTAAQKILINSLTENWDLISSAWKNLSKTDYTYGSGSEVAITSSYNTLTSLWTNSTKSETTFDISGNTTLVVNYIWSAAWVNQSKTEYVYNATGDKTSETTSSWNGSAFVFQTKTDYSYDAGRNLTTETSSTYNSGTSSWVNASKTDYTYSGGYESQEITSTWDLTIPGWVNSDKLNYSYDGSGNQILAVDQKWDKTIPGWVNSDKTEMAYDVSGFLNLLTSSTWDTSVNPAVWVYSMKIELVFDAGGNLTQSTSSSWDTGTSSWTELTVSVTTYSALQTITTNQTNLGGILMNSSRVTLNYSDATRVGKLDEGSFKIYPNPVKDYIIIDFQNGQGTGQAELYDMFGRKVLDIRQSGSRQVIPASDLQRGVYLYKVQSGGKTTTGKLVVE